MQARTPARVTAVVPPQQSMIVKARMTVRGRVVANPATTVAPAKTPAKARVAAKFLFPKTTSNG